MAFLTWEMWPLLHPSASARCSGVMEFPGGKPLGCSKRHLIQTRGDGENKEGIKPHPTASVQDIRDHHEESHSARDEEAAPNIAALAAGGDGCVMERAIGRTLPRSRRTEVDFSAGSAVW